MTDITDIRQARMRLYLERARIQKGLSECFNGKAFDNVKDGSIRPLRADEYDSLRMDGPEDAA